MNPSLATPNDPHFGYSLEIENAMVQFFGRDSGWSESASQFHDPARVRKAIAKASSRIKTRLEELATMDDRLLLTTGLALEELKSASNQLGKKPAAQLAVIGVLLDLIARLLDYDWSVGKVNREVVYFQTAEQLRVDDLKRHPRETVEARVILSIAKRREIVARLRREGLRIPQIAGVMRLSEKTVKSFLVSEGLITRKTQTKEE